MKNLGSEEFQKDMKDFDNLLKKLRSEFNQHLIGNLKAPPEFTVALARKLVRKYAADRTLKGTQRFQYFNLVAKFNTLMEFNTRRLRDKELGRPISYRIIKESPNSELAGKVQTSQDASKPTDKGHIVANAQRQQVTLRKMFEVWTDLADHANQTPEMDFDKFQRVIAQKTEQLLEQKQCKAIRYKMSVQDGKIRIQAKPIK